MYWKETTIYYQSTILTLSFYTAGYHTGNVISKRTLIPNQIFILVRSCLTDVKLVSYLQNVTPLRNLITTSQLLIVYRVLIA